jgi:DNA-binding transcriptional regulator YiaG
MVIDTTMGEYDSLCIEKARKLDVKDVTRIRESV